MTSSSLSLSGSDDTVIDDRSGRFINNGGLHSKVGITDNATPCHIPARPPPLEVVPADAAVHIADLAADVQARADARLHRLQSNLAQRHSAGRDLRVGEAAVA